MVGSREEVPSWVVYVTSTLSEARLFAGRDFDWRVFAQLIHIMLMLFRFHIEYISPASALPVLVPILRSPLRQIPQLPGTLQL